MCELHMVLAPKLTTSLFTPYNLQQDQKFAPNNHFPMARMQSEKCHLLGYGKPSNSTPTSTLLPGRSQARTGDFPSILETSGMTSMERLATSPRHSFDGMLRGTPATITSEVADTGIGSGVEEHQEQPEVLPPQADQEKFQAASPKDICDLKPEPKLDPEAHSTAALDESYEPSQERSGQMCSNTMLPSIQVSCQITDIIVVYSRWLLHLWTIHSIGVLTYYQMRSTPEALWMTPE
ncbi:hypothetical protein BKA83DRAFT_4339015, partial [Pisolithus microcarpus]